MTMIDPQMTLGELVDEYPALAREFERRGLDYCCGGGRTLAAACVGRGLDPAATAVELAAAAGERAPADWSTMAVDDLCDHLEATHHAYLWEELPRLSALVEKIRSVHGDRHPELAEIARVYEEIRADLEPHLLKEERVLFPLVHELAGAQNMPSFHCGSVRNPIGVMLAEHDRVGDLLARLRMLTGDYTPPADGCASYTACFAGLAELEADTHLHIHKENNILFPKAVRLEAELSAAG